ncbi:bacterial translation initiation factor 3 (bIF-3) [Garciella nitratireducens DSM 15102]|uniref:Translation initiation factor IF-3 n=1 Tax=Garciella nitratireducens DSM 15102 TaxID=1121911 RepID=A0A1T4KS84_9FIRM|nr:translation initiation factor IF-3 [Garciella nitratireducens]SJZ45276.1 bacterial translation initiation factor 3 (bIF-3) [Garciella nitratireducens DSM 15102]
MIDNDGKQLGIMSGREAQKIADEKQLDLVKISPNTKPPVCKIMDYGKFKFEQGKKEKEMKKHQRTINVKEVRMSARVEEHDLDVKAKNCRKFLLNGDKVKVSVRFRGREMAYTDVGKEILLRFAEKVADVGQIEKRPKLEGRNMVMYLMAKKEQ